MSPSVHLVTFGGGHPRWRRAARRVGRSAHRSGLFASATVLDAAWLAREHPAFVDEHRAMLQRGVRGFGYWIWKPLVVAHALAQVPAGHLVLYVDGGHTLNLADAAPRRRFAEYLDMARATGGLAMQLKRLPERHWTKADTARRLGLTDHHLASGQIEAGTLLLAPTATNRQLVDTWRQICVEDHYHLIDDSPSVAPEHDDFVQHRYDQSILSGLLKTTDTGITLLANETFVAEPFPSSGAAFPLWATRHGWAAPKYTRLPVNLPLVAEKVATRTLDTLTRRPW
jgi:hypothetical protein